MMIIIIIRQVKLNTKYYENCERVLMKYLKDNCALTAFSDQVVIIVIIIIVIVIITIVVVIALMILSQEILNALGLFEMFGVGLQNGLFAFSENDCEVMTVAGARAIFPTLLSFQHKCSPNT